VNSPTTNAPPSGAYATSCTVAAYVAVAVMDDRKPAVHANVIISVAVDKGLYIIPCST
jgi:hypothetical protein